MEELKEILSTHHSKVGDAQADVVKKVEVALNSSIPDLFFDEILINYKMSRNEITLLLDVYRRTWCKANIYKKYGISPLFNYKEMQERLNMEPDAFFNSVSSLENYGFIETIRSGQYFVRKYFTPELDSRYGQTYENSL